MQSVTPRTLLIGRIMDRNQYAANLTCKIPYKDSVLHSHNF